MNTTAQQKSITWFKNDLTSDRFSRADLVEHPIVWEIEEKATEYGTWVIAHATMPSLPKGNLLRCLTTADSWMVLVGPRGGITVHVCPKSSEQFAGRRINHMKFKRSVSRDYKPRS